MVAMADHDHSVGELECQLEMLSNQTLMLLQDSEGPRDTLDWRCGKDWITAHYHVRCPTEVLSIKGQTRQTSHGWHGF